jgi:hypothetical protein
MPRNLIWLILLGTVSSELAQARSPTWHLVNTDGQSGRATFVDAANIIYRRGGRLTAWTMINYRDPQTDTYRHSEYRSEISLETFDCIDRRSALITLTKFTADRGDGDVEDKLEFDDKDLRWNYIRPGSIGEAVLDYVCGHAPKRL